MSEKRKTFRHRNRKGNWASKELIHTFWVGQLVVRSWERKNFMDQIGEQGVVVELPAKQGGSLIVKNEGGELAKWDPTECIPYRKLIETNRRRLLGVAKNHTARLKELDENGVRIE